MSWRTFLRSRIHFSPISLNTRILLGTTQHLNARNESTRIIIPSCCATVPIYASLHACIVNSLCRTMSCFMDEHQPIQLKSVPRFCSFSYLWSSLLFPNRSYIRTIQYDPVFWAGYCIKYYVFFSCRCTQLKSFCDDFSRRAICCGRVDLSVSFLDHFANFATSDSTRIPSKAKHTPMYIKIIILKIRQLWLLTLFSYSFVCFLARNSGKDAVHIVHNNFHELVGLGAIYCTDQIVCFIY